MIPGGAGTGLAAAVAAAVTVGAAGPAAPPVPASAPASSSRTDTLTSADLRDDRGWRFRAGEASRYRVAVALGRGGAAGTVGEARLRVEGPARVDGRPTTRVVMEMEARIPLVYRLRNRRTSWVATGPFRSLRFEEDLREGDYRRHRRYRLHQDEGTYTRFDRTEGGGWRRVPAAAGVEMPPAALDEVAFLYFLRSLPLEVGRTYRFRRMFETDANPVLLEVLRRERIRVPAGRFRTLVVRPVIRSSGLFSEGGEAEVYLTDDHRRLIVRVDSRMAMGRLHLYLEEHRPGGTG